MSLNGLLSFPLHSGGVSRLHVSNTRGGGEGGREATAPAAGVGGDGLGGHGPRVPAWALCCPWVCSHGPGDRPVSRTIFPSPFLVSPAQHTGAGEVNMAGRQGQQLGLARRWGTRRG